ncbi:hypothetical protein SM007_12335 [Streptomyces avermitilis]|nr:hypothetical protein SM007_12335 [Streptomyces avermitilis]
MAQASCAGPTSSSYGRRQWTYARRSSPGDSRRSSDLAPPPYPDRGGVRRRRRARRTPRGHRPASGRSLCTAVLVKAGYRQWVIYQPADHFWALQWAETGIFLGLAVALAGVCVRRIRRLA